MKNNRSAVMHKLSAMPCQKREVKSMGKIKPTQRIYAVVKDIEDDRLGTNLFPEVKILESLPYLVLGRMINSRTELRL